MSELLIRQALEKALDGMTPALPTAWENADFTPQPKVAYQEVFFMPAEPVTLGDVHREQGILQVDLRYPKGVGPAAAAGRAELMKTVFKRGASFPQGGVTVQMDKNITVMQGRHEGDRWVVPVRIRYFANIQG